MVTSSLDKTRAKLRSIIYPQMHFSGEELNQSIPFANETQTRPENAKLLIYSCTVEAAHSVSEGRKGGGGHGSLAMAAVCYIQRRLQRKLPQPLSCEQTLA